MRPILLGLALSLLVAAPALARDSVTPSGHVVTEPRPISGDMHGVEIIGPVDVVLDVGPATKLTLEADDNLLPQITTEVRDGLLRVGFEGAFQGKATLKAHLSLPRADELRIHGSGNIEAAGFSGGPLSVLISGSGNVRADGHVERLAIRVRGSGNTDLDKLTARETSIEIRGSGDVKLSQIEGPSVSITIGGSGDVRIGGAVEKLDIAVAGSGDVDATGLKAQNARVVVNGSGDVHVHAEKTLDVVGKGDGNVDYTGSPQVTGNARRRSS